MAYKVIYAKKNIFQKIGLAEGMEGIEMEENRLTFFYSKKESDEFRIDEIDELHFFTPDGAKIDTLTLTNFQILPNWLFCVLINTEKKQIKIEKKQFDGGEINTFLAEIIQKYKENKTTLPEKIDKIIAKCKVFLKRDLGIEEEIQQHLYEAYSSVYDAYTIDKNEKDVLSILKSPEIVFYKMSKYSYYYYFLENHYKASASKSSISIADNLIKTLLKNRSIVETRKESYRIIEGRLEGIRQEYQQREQLKKLAQKVDALQERNLQGGFKKEEMHNDIEIVKQLDMLTDVVQGVETYEKSCLLKENADIFKTSFEQEENFLREITLKLK